MSRPARGAWIEIANWWEKLKHGTSRPARGAWIEIDRLGGDAMDAKRRAPQGARGLKCRSLGQLGAVAASRPARGAWIEMVMEGTSLCLNVVAPRKGRVD